MFWSQARSNPRPSLFGASSRPACRRPCTERRQLNLPSADDVQSLVAPISELQWASLRPELRALLTNLKILDWLVAAARSGKAINPASIISVSYLMDALWERWVEGDADQLGRSHLLMRLGMLEGDTLLASVPRMQLEQSEQAALGSLTSSDLVRIRDQRVRFTHDMLGDWARLNVLISEPSLSAPSVRSRAKMPRWHRAMRLFGQRLLEQADDGAERWRQAVEGLEDGTEEGAIIRDQLIEALFLATNAVALLQRSWEALTANRGRLLALMLERFMFTATLARSEDRRAVVRDRGDGRVGPSVPATVLALLGADADRAPRSSRRGCATCSACGRQALRIVAEVSPRRAGRRTGDALAKASGRTCRGHRPRSPGAQRRGQLLFQGP